MVVSPYLYGTRTTLGDRQQKIEPSPIYGRHLHVNLRFSRMTQYLIQAFWC
jgi:hypothetical protein